MTDVPPPRPTTPPRADGRPMPETARYSRSSMWLVFLVLAAVILVAIAFGVDRSTSVVDPVATEPVATEPAATPDATATVPVEPTDPAAPTGEAPATDGGTTGGDATGSATGDEPTTTP